METPQIKMIDNDDGTVKYSSMHHPEYLITRLDFLRSEGSATDIVLKVEDKLFHCHKLILIALSPYFEGMFRGRNFSESTINTVNLEEVSPAAVDSLLTFFYTGSIIISEEIIADLLFAANMWQLKDVMESCNLFVKRLVERKPETAVSILRLSILYDFTELLSLSRKLICQNFDVAFRQPDFIRLPYKELTFIMGSKQLSAPKELILNSIVKWFEYNQETTDQMDLNSLFCFIPIHFVNLECLRETCSKELWQRFPLCDRFFKSVIAIIEQSLEVEEIEAGQNVEQRSGNEIYILDGNSNSESLIKFDIESGNCDRLANVPHQHTCFGSSFISNKIFAIDAWNSCAVSKYDPQLDNWASCKPLPSKRLGSSAAVLNQTIYVCGGQDSDLSVLNSVVNYNPENDVWLPVASMQQHRSGACVAELNGFLYAIGGFDGTNRLSSCERYAPSSNRWESISSLPSPRYSAAVVSVNNSLYVIGGWDEGNTEVSSVFKYDVSSASWSSCTEMVFSASNLSACAIGSRIFVSGGEGNDGRLNKTAVFNVTSNSWTEGPDLPHPCSYHASFPVIE